ncbi:uncharacterized protein [Onthophagus taurus]|uniref:uncharacterized protein isoform X1 n=2 Tax=Onthophagus taurus TaxID=166361 RepID=UPI0039BE0502
MLATNVLCLKKKRKKKSYYVANVAQYGGKQSVDKRSPRSTVTMMHITEDTPPDMLAGAMDLTVHLPTGRCVKLSVERSTPMMDLLVQITTVHNLQLSGHILEAMDMTRSGGVGERVLPYKPNTPIGALDTQHIKVVPKNKTSSGLTKVSSLGHQPFESTFRLKVHLPRNQLYVTRVSQSVYLEEIIKKVCEEKGLDPAKYELRHPGNLDEVLDPNLTLSDYQITEIYVVGKGSGRLVQTFSSSDIMALRKEEERKQFQAKTGGGVFNLIFKRPKSIIQEPPLTHQIDRTENTKSLPPPVTKEPPQERPKPPQRKRRPAPKPPMPTQQQPIEAKNPTIETTHNHIHPPSNGTGPSKTDNGLIISHSRNSSDSSGYHEASVLSENCNTSLPRRPKSIYDENGNRAKLNNKSSSSNLEKMQSHSKSMSSLGVLARKKKAAPPPPKPIQKEVDNVETTISPVVASQPIETIPVTTTLGRSASLCTNAPVPAPRKQKSSESSSVIIDNENNRPITFLNKDINHNQESSIKDSIKNDENKIEFTENSLKSPIDLENHPLLTEASNEILINQPDIDSASMDLNVDEQDTQSVDIEPKDLIKDDDLSIYSDQSLNLNKSHSMDSLLSDTSLNSGVSKSSKPEIVGVIPKKRKSTNFDTLTRSRGFHIGASMINMETESDRISLATTSEENCLSDHRSISSSRLSEEDASNDFDLDIKEDIFEKPQEIRKHKSGEKKRNELLGIHTIDRDEQTMNTNRSVSSLRSMDSIPGFIKKWNNDLELDNISNISDGSIRVRNKQWIVGDSSDTESITTNITTNNSPPESPIITTIQPQITPNQDEISSLIKEDEIVVLKNQVNLENKMELSDLDHKNEVDSGICENNLSDTPEKEDVVEKGIEEVIDKEDVIKKEENIPENLQKEEIGCIEKVENINDNKDNENNEKIKDNIEKETEWKYQLPSPPKGFRDVSPAMRTCNYTSCDSETISDSVVTSPELFEKLKQINDVQSIASDIPSVISQEEIYEEKDICNKLTLENLEKRKSLVYKRELATSLKYAQSETNSDKRSTTKSDVLDELEDVIKNEKPNFLKNNVSKPIIEIKHDRHLPNFKISTYDGKKEKINIFEDETIRSSDKFHRVTENDADKNQKNLINENVVNRSESFSGSKLSLNPVRRSKSQVGFSKYNEKPQQINTESVSRSNSLLDVSGLQSLEVMKIIQNKLTNSKDAINTSDQEKNPSISEKSQRESPIQELPDKKIIEEPIQTSSVATKRQYFQGPPCIELGSWSQRPKTEVTLKEDTDYKFGMGLKPTPSSSSVYLNSTSFNKKPIGTSIKIGSDNNNTVTTTVININNDQKESERVTNQFRNDIFRKPFQKNPRPHSIAIDNHIPIVRSVELKKQFQDLPPTINNVIHFDNNQPKSLSYLNLNKESTRKEPMLRPVIRNNSFNPVVKGFRIQNSNDFYGTLPSSNKNTLNNTNTESNSNNKPNMFSQTNLRRTESASGKPIFGNVVLRNNSNNMKHVKPDQRHSLSVIPPPPPPVLPTLKPVKKAMNNNAGMSPVDNRNQLLLEIRNFGGKKGLKSKK